MSRPQPQPYTLYCVLDDDQKIPFPVKAESSTSVGELKKYIKEEAKLDHVAAHELTLYQANTQESQVRTAAEIENKIKDLKEEPLQPLSKLVKYFPTPPPEETIHIIVILPKGSMDTGKRKRDSADVGDQVTKRARNLERLTSVTPSSVRLKDITRDPQLRDNMTINRPKASCTTIPIALIHHVFAQFLEDCQNREPSEQDNQWLARLRHRMLLQYNDEAARCSEFRQIFEEEMGIPIPDASIPGTLYRTDGHISLDGLFLLVSEGKNEWVGMSADPQLQAFFYYIEVMKMVEKKKDVDSSPLPCLIIYYVGSFIGFAGVVTTDKPQFEPLTPLFDLSTNQHDVLALKPIARALGAVRRAIKCLQEYYTELRPKPKGSHPLIIDQSLLLSRNYYTNHSGAKVEFDCQRRLDNDKLLFLALTRSDNRNVVLKFTQKYSEEAHAYCASKQIAPELHAVEKLGGGWMMVVMEYLDNDVYTVLRGLEYDAQFMAENIKNAVAILHAGGFVHGDIRDVNVMVTRNPAHHQSVVKLIDFDWAGRDQTARYPANVNREGINRPEDARDGEPITKEHDEMMVKYLFPDPNEA